MFPQTISNKPHSPPNPNTSIRQVFDFHSSPSPTPRMKYQFVTNCYKVKQQTLRHPLDRSLRVRPAHSEKRPTRQTRIVREAWSRSSNVQAIPPSPVPSQCVRAGMANHIAAVSHLFKAKARNQFHLRYQEANNIRRQSEASRASHLIICPPNDFINQEDRRVDPETILSSQE